MKSLVPQRLRDASQLQGIALDDPADPPPHVLGASVATDGIGNLYGRTSWRAAAVVFACASFGLLVVSVSYALSRTGTTGAEPLFWLGFLLILAPFTLRLASSIPSRAERLIHVVSLTVLLYMIKVVHSPFAFTFGDELVHLRNLDDILRLGGLTPQNSVLPVTTEFPGLETLTAGLVQMSGLSAFVCGLVVIGVARLVLMLCLFLIFERLTGSARIAGMATLIYTADPNFVFWSSEYSYESLALPIATLAILAVTDRAEARSRAERHAWTVVAILATTAVVLTHHMTAYALVGLLLVISVIATARGRRAEAAWGLFAYGAGAVIVWDVLVAPLTFNYLDAILVPAVTDVAHTISGTGQGRPLFGASTGSGGSSYPLDLRAVTVLAVLFIIAVLPFGLLVIWRRKPRKTLALILGVAAVAYIFSLPARLVPSAWETANRSSEFLFIGVSLVIALAAHYFWGPGQFGRRRTAVALVFVGVVAIGGVCAGWQPNVLMSQPLYATVGGHEIAPEGITAAQWTLTAVGPDRRFVADNANGRLLLALGRQMPFVGPDGRARTVMGPDSLTTSVVSEIHDYGISYVLIDRRAIAVDPLAGYFIPAADTPLDGGEGLIPKGQITKFDVPSVSRIYDSGNIVIYDVRRIRS